MTLYVQEKKTDEVEESLQIFSLIFHQTSDIIRLMAYTLNIMPRRQITLPNDLLKQMGVGVGDSLEIKLEGKKAVIKSKKQIALEALKEIQAIVKESGITEKEMLRDLDRQRREAVRTRE